jgi:hypothetical protein
VIESVRGLSAPVERYLPAAESVTETLLAEYPEILERYGERARTFGVHDSAYLVGWVVNAVELYGAEPLRRDVLWLRDLLAARSFPLGPFRRNLELVSAATIEFGFASAAEVESVTRDLLLELAAEGGTTDGR